MPTKHLVKAIALLLALWSGPAWAGSMTLLGVGKPAAAAGYTGPGDVTGFTTGVIAWWGLRGFSSTTSGAIFNVCDAATGATCADATWSSAGGGTLTIPTIGGNACDNATHQCEIAKFYDQSGQTNCTTACDASAPHGSRAILTVSCVSSKPCATSSGLASYTTPSNTGTSSQPFTMTAVAQRTSVSQQTIVSFGANLSQILFASSAGNAGLYTGGSVPTASAADSTRHTFEALFNNASSVLQVDATSNSISVGTANGITSGGTANGIFGNASGVVTGDIEEGGVWTGDKSANFSNMHSNQCAYWGTTC